ncbi:hypothetical protein [Legionella cherrii]|uniref:Uncharacterized protein n=1 Tax=Legionella cherrii TaxID=28084 RepID=A0A0W0SAL5_9GAMM|nr:hypothetical protein [Legionella cherrii]KTC79941.1 hypothetical protein Lche_1961 [Legionella cherrii]VEB38305.1 Uncharacterised protein [Legionella cherrii]
MKKTILFILGYVLMCCSQLLNAQTNTGKLLEAKMDEAEIYLNKTQNTPKAWKLAVEISKLIKEHPEYDDGEFAEGMIDVVSKLLTKPWNYASPYLTGNKSTAAFRQFVIDHINELTDPEDLKAIKKNILKNCDQTKHLICQQIIAKIQSSMP